VGSSINVLPLRARVDPERPLRAWLAELRETQIRIGEHEHTPMERLREWCEVPPDRLLFDSYMIMQNQMTSVAGSKGLFVEMAETEEEPPFSHIKMEYPLRFDVYPGARTLLLSMTYYRRRLAAATVERLLRDLRALLEAIVAAAPDAMLGELPGRPGPGAGRGSPAAQAALPAGT